MVMYFGVLYFFLFLCWMYLKTANSKGFSNALSGTNSDNNGSKLLLELFILHLNQLSVYEGFYGFSSQNGLCHIIPIS